MMPPRVLASGPKPCGGNKLNFLFDIVACILAYADGLSSSPNHHAEILLSYVIIDQAPYGHLSHLPIPTCGHSA